MKDKEKMKEHLNELLKMRQRIAESDKAFRKTQDEDELKKRVEERTKDLTEVQEATLSILEDLQEARDELEISRASFHNIVERSEDGIIIVDNDGIVRFINPMIKTLFGLKGEELAGKLFDLPIVTGKSIEIDITRSGGEAGTGEMRVVETEWEEKKAKLVSIRDITERKRAEEEVRHTLEKLRNILGGTIRAMALTVETRDPYTAGHQRRVVNLARAIADEMGLPEEQIDGIRVAGAIHDLGKISVPAEILSKPGRITDIEFSLIKAHPQVGYDILKTIEFPWPVAQIVLQHHERMDGSGYPNGIKGKDIILEARVLSVADVVEAMSSHRPYRAALGVEKALEEIKKKKVILYDPEVVNACLGLFKEKGFKFE